MVTKEISKKKKKLETRAIADGDRRLFEGRTSHEACTSVQGKLNRWLHHKVSQGVALDDSCRVCEKASLSLVGCEDNSKTPRGLAHKQRDVIAVCFEDFLMGIGVALLGAGLSKFGRENCAERCERTLRFHQGLCYPVLVKSVCSGGVDR